MVLIVLGVQDVPVLVMVFGCSSVQSAGVAGVATGGVLREQHWLDSGRAAVSRRALPERVGRLRRLTCSVTLSFPHAVCPSPAAGLQHKAIEGRAMAAKPKPEMWLRREGPGRDLAVAVCSLKARIFSLRGWNLSCC